MTLLYANKIGTFLCFYEGKQVYHYENGEDKNDIEIVGRRNKEKSGNLWEAKEVDRKGRRRTGIW